jgi:phosphorylase kinase alpha/beta subunit
MLETGSQALLELMQELKDGICHGVQVKLGKLNQLMLTAAIQRIDFLSDTELSQSSVANQSIPCHYLTSHLAKSWSLGHTKEFQMECETNLDLLLEYLRSSENIYEQIELLQTLTRLQGLEFDTGYAGPNHPVTVADLLDEVYTKAGDLGLWAVVRRAAGLLQMLDIRLSDAITSILVQGKQIAVGRAYSQASLIVVPISGNEITEKINHFCREDIRDRVLTQEILIYLGVLIKSEPELFRGFITLRVGYLILLITSDIAREFVLTQDEAYEQLMQLSPFEVKMRLRQVLTGYSGVSNLLRQQESLHVKQKESDIAWVVLPTISEEIEIPADGWRRFRQTEGALNRVPKNFFKEVWLLMQHCKGLVIGDKLERRNRLESEIMLSEMTAGERNFALLVEHLLNKIEAPEYRQVNVEALMELATIVANNPNLQIEEYIVLDVLIGHAVRLAWLENHPHRSDNYDEDKATAWPSFYNSSPQDCANYILKAFRFLTEFVQDI